MALEDKISNENEDKLNTDEDFEKKVIKSLNKRHATMAVLGTIMIPLTYYSGHLPDSFFSDGYTATLLTMVSALNAYDHIYNLIKNK